MSGEHPKCAKGGGVTRRRFLSQVGMGGVVPAVLRPESILAASDEGTVARRKLGQTGLEVSEIGFGGHSWAYDRAPDGKGGFRKPTVDEAVEMIRCGLDMGVNLFDSCSALEESSVPGEALKRLGARDRALIIVRVSHRMKGREKDREEIYKWTEKRLKLWQTDVVDLLLLCNTSDDTPQSGYWDMSYSMEALDKLKEQGKIRFTGFGCHFTPELFLEAFDKYGEYFDVCSIPYNIRHRAAERVLPAAKEAGLGVLTIKPFARGALLGAKDLDGEDAGLPRDMISFVLENKEVDSCICGVHTLAQVKENFSASWTGLTDEARQRLDIAANTSCGTGHAWLEEGWRYA